MEGHLLMSRKELNRKSILELVLAKQLTLMEASVRMNLGYRQALRVYQRFVAEGDMGLMHRGRGTPSNGPIRLVSGRRCSGATVNATKSTDWGPPWPPGNCSGTV